MLVVGKMHVSLVLICARTAFPMIFSLNFETAVIRITHDSYRFLLLYGKTSYSDQTTTLLHLSSSFLSCMCVVLIAARCAALQWGVFVTDCAQKVGIL